LYKKSVENPLKMILLGFPPEAGGGTEPKICFSEPHNIYAALAPSPPRVKNNVNVNTSWQNSFKKLFHTILFHSGT
jgi:hypothetical protein